MLFDEVRREQKKFLQQALSRKQLCYYNEKAPSRMPSSKKSINLASLE